MLIGVVAAQKMLQGLAEKGVILTTEEIYRLRRGDPKLIAMTQHVIRPETEEEKLVRIHQRELSELIWDACQAKAGTRSPKVSEL